MRTIEEYKKMTYKVVLEYKGQDRVYVARFPELPGCIAHGDTPQEALDYALRVKDDWLETAFESGWSIPEPSEVPETSGRITVRTPKYMHRQLIDRAEEEGISLNQLILSFIAQGLQNKMQEHASKAISAKQDQIIALLEERERARQVTVCQGRALSWNDAIEAMSFETAWLDLSLASSASNILGRAVSGATTSGSFFSVIGEEETNELAPARIPASVEYGKNYQTGGCQE